MDRKSAWLIALDWSLSILAQPNSSQNFSAFDTKRTTQSTEASSQRGPWRLPDPVPERPRQCTDVQTMKQLAEGHTANMGQNLNYSSFQSTPAKRVREGGVTCQQDQHTVSPGEGTAYPGREERQRALGDTSGQGHTGLGRRCLVQWQQHKA